MRRTAEDTEKTRITLLEAALVTFKNRGWQGATFDRIAEHVGLTRGAVHHHFKNKTMLLEEALTWGWDVYGAQLFATPLANTQNDAQQWLTEFLVKYLKFLQHDTRFQALAATTVLVAPQAFADQTTASSHNKNDTLDTWRAHLTSAVSAAARPETANRIAGLILVFLQGATVSAVTRPADLPEPDQIEAAMRMYVRGLLSP